MHQPIDRITHTTVFLTPFVHWLERLCLNLNRYKHENKGREFVLNDALNTFYFLYRHLGGPIPIGWRHITINVLSASLNKTFPSFLYTHVLPLDLYEDD